MWLCPEEVRGTPRGELGLGCEQEAWQGPALQWEGRAGGVPPRARVCVSEASLNGQRLTLWGPLLGQRWEGPSGPGWGFSKSGNLRKSSGKPAARVLPTLGAGWKDRCGPALSLPQPCHWSSGGTSWGLGGEGGADELWPPPIRCQVLALWAILLACLQQLCLGLPSEKTLTPSLHPSPRTLPQSETRPGKSSPLRPYPDVP